MKRKLWIDFETFSSHDIVKGGAYRYFEAIDFEILMGAYAFDNEPVKLFDMAYRNEAFPDEVIEAFYDDETLIYARNAAFERLALRAIGHDLPIEKFRCTAVVAASNGLPLSLEASGKAVGLGEDKAKNAKGKALIRFFSIPCKPMKSNGLRFRNLPKHNLEKWDEFCDYCIQDVEADRNVYNAIHDGVLAREWMMYRLDQQINDRGVLIDTTLVNSAIRFDEIFKTEVLDRMAELTGLSNPNSVAQLKEWLTEELEEDVTSLAKGTVSELLKETTDGTILNEVLQLRVMASKTSVKKYYAMLNCLCDDGRAHGLFQFMGAMRTGRWAGRLIQLQNLPQNHIDDLEEIREIVRDLDYTSLSIHYPDIASVLSQLIRTALVAPPKKTNAVADFSAIEARVIAWLSGESWRMDVFNTHGMIYEASASQMFNVPIDSIVRKENGVKVQGENYDMRQKGKVAELALGYQGGWRALETMGGSKMGLSQTEMENIVKLFRLSNKNIVSLWYDLDRCAIKATKLKGTKVISKFKGLEFLHENDCLTIKLPSGRKLSYYKAFIGQSRFDSDCVKYYGVNDKKAWTVLDTYGGKLTENVVQAIARDCLVETLMKLDKLGYKITMHVHDEVVAEVPEHDAEKYLAEMCRVMAEPIEWAKDLPLTADGYITKFYKKD